jgi:hypothetical protein
MCGVSGWDSDRTSRLNGGHPAGVATKSTAAAMGTSRFTQSTEGKDLEFNGLFLDLFFGGGVAEGSSLAVLL